MARPRKGVTFWDRVYSQVEQQNHCLVFTGHRDGCGYGRINRNGKLVRLHRAVWERDNGAVPTGKVIMHTCDNPPCIEPSHLRLGTQAENIADMDNKARRVVLIGTKQSQAKLTEPDIPVIRALIASGRTSAAISKQFGVSEGAIQAIKKGRRWTHVSQ